MMDFKKEDYYNLMIQKLGFKGQYSLATEEFTALNETQISAVIREAEAEELVYDQRRTNQEARQYLTSTDWYIVRQTETGVEVPAEVLTKRAEVRAKVK